FDDRVPAFLDLVLHLCFIPNKKDSSTRLQDALTFSPEGKRVEPMESRSSKNKINTFLRQGCIFRGGRHGDKIFHFAQFSFSDPAHVSVWFYRKHLDTHLQ